MNLKIKIRKLFNIFGLDIIRARHSPRKTLLGLSARNISSVIDVGANEGQFGRSILDIFPGAHLYCFEPLAAPFQKLLAWSGSSSANVRCFNLAIGDVERTVEMHCHIHHSPSSSILASTAHGHEIYPQTASEIITNVKLTTLDTILGQEIESMPKPILLKLDVQGFEDRVLRGASKILEKCEVCLLEVCLDPLYEEQANFIELANLLFDAGFKYAGNLDQAYAMDGHVIYLDAVFVRS